MALLTSIILPRCQRTSEQDEVRKVLKDVQRAAEEKDIRTIQGNISRSYRDPQGYDYNGNKGLLLYHFFRHQKISVYATNIDVMTDGISARSTFQAVLSTSDKTESVTDVLPDALGIYVLTVVFSKWEISII